MGLLDWFKPDKEDRSLIEISNDAGDHWVADVPTSGVKETEQALRNAGLEQDRDDTLIRRYDASDVVSRRDPNQHRYRSERVVDEAEDLEDSYDRENDTSDYEPDDMDYDDSDYE